MREAREKLMKRKGGSSSPKKPREEAPPNPDLGTKKPSYHSVKKNLTEKDISQFDYSKKVDDEAAIQNKVEEAKSRFLGDGEELKDDRFVDSDEELDLSSDEEEGKSGGGGIFAKFTSKIKNFTGNKEMTEEDLQPVMKMFADLLTEKNVAADIAEELCQSVIKTLMNQKTKSFTTIKTTVKEALVESMRKILTPKKKINILKDAIAAQKRGEPYKIVFIGVNGVGKSTSLAKVAYYLKTKGNLRVSLAACDNFRSGAVE